MPTGLKSIREITYRKIKPLAEELGISRRRLERFVRGELDQLDLTLREHQALSNHPVFQGTMEGLCPDVSQPPSMASNEPTEKPSFEVKLKVELTNGAVHLKTDKGEVEESLQLDLL